jgi:ubiquinone/menaquinone biosynthesis C-methylase UbiE
MNSTHERPYKGRGMDGWIARWYARTRSRDIEDFRRQAKSVAERLGSGSHILEVAPGPGFFAIELARLGNFKITGLDISRTFVDLSAESARKAGVDVDFRLGNASAMPFAGESFDFVYCSAAFKNFSEPIKALDEMYRVLRPGGQALVIDLRKDASLDEISFYVSKSGRSRIDAWATVWVFRHMLIKRAYRKEDFVHMAEASRFSGCQINLNPIGFEVRFTKPAPVASAVC